LETFILSVPIHVVFGTNFRESDLLRSVPDLELPLVLKKYEHIDSSFRKEGSISNLAKDIL